MKEKSNKSCQCESCKSACKSRPCWPTPDDAKKLIKAGFGYALMLDWWADEDENPDHIIYLLCPAVVGYAKAQSPFIPEGRCVFLDENDLCLLHDLGLKPYEGRRSNHDESQEVRGDRHEAIATGWDNEDALNLVKAWCKEFNVELGHREPTDEDKSRLRTMFEERNPFAGLFGSIFGE